MRETRQTHLRHRAIADTQTGTRLPLQYAPPRLQGEDTTAWAEQQVPGSSHKLAHFVSADDRRLTLELELTAEEEDRSDVRRKVEWLRSLTFPEYRDGEVVGGPHPVLLAGFPAFEGKTYRVLKVSWEYSDLHPSGEYESAKVTVELSELGESMSYDEVRR